MSSKRPSRSKKSAGSKAGSSAGLRAAILEEFSNYWSEEGHPPRSVARFCKDLGISESVFFKHFPSLHAVEKAFLPA